MTGSHAIGANSPRTWSACSPAASATGVCALLSRRTPSMVRVPLPA